MMGIVGLLFEPNETKPDKLLGQMTENENQFRLALIFRYTFVAKTTSNMKKQGRV